jgi:hypothetical protein
MSESTKTTTVTLGRGLTIRTPVPAAPSPGHPIDSRAMTFTGNGVTVVVDEGPFAASLADDGRHADHRSATRTIAGQQARVVSYTDSDGAKVAGTRLVLPADGTAGEPEATVTITVRVDAHLGFDAAVRAVESLTRT